MSPELQEKLYAEYPAIFRQKDLSASMTCMCWGITCNDGWFNLIDTLCAFIKYKVEQHGSDNVEALQVKEKFGGLRFYHTSNDPEIRGAVQITERLSLCTCERCGTMENVGRTEKGSKGFAIIKTLCEPCYETWKLERLEFRSEAEPWKPLT